MTERQEQMIYDEGFRRGYEKGKAERHKMLDDGTLVVSVADATAVTRVLVEDDKKNGDLYYNDRPKGEVNAVEIYEREIHNLDQGYITLGEFDERIKPLEHLYYDRPKGEWIPCSERLPKEEKKRYWVCTDTGYQCECRWTNASLINSQPTNDWHWNLFDTPQYTRVVAWMPLPKPYERSDT